MKMKLLDYTLISLLAGAAPLATAQESTKETTAQSEAPPAEAMTCTEEACSGEDGLLFKLRTRSYSKPVTEGTTTKSSSEALQPDRRVSVALEQPGKAVAIGKWSISLPNGGVIWATEDPTLGRPEMNVSGTSLVSFDGTKVLKPVRFYAYNNYASFIQRA
ncbi:hypothetical protein ACTOWK_23535, partial [Lysobacter sp. CA196]